MIIALLLPVYSLRQLHFRHRDLFFKFLRWRVVVVAKLINWRMLSSAFFKVAITFNANDLVLIDILGAAGVVLIVEPGRRLRQLLYNVVNI